MNKRIYIEGKLFYNFLASGGRQNVCVTILIQDRKTSWSQQDLAPEPVLTLELRRKVKSEKGASGTKI